MSLRDTFASRLREAREQAKDLTSKLNFDEMAANDAYIHSDDFNVRGQPRAYEKEERIKPSVTDQHHVQQPYPERRQGTNMDSIDEASSTASVSGSMSAAFHASVSTVGSSSAWSLLDRPNGSSAVKAENIDNTPDAPTPHKIKTTTNDNHNDESSVPASVTTPSKAPATPLLSIVTDTLQDTPPAVKSTRSDGIHHDLPHLTQQSSSCDDDSDSFSDDDDDNDSHHDDDEEDPILAMMQSDKEYSCNHSKRRRDRRKNKSSKHNKNRFMEDLDRRLEQPPNDELLLPLSAATLEIEQGTDPPEASAPSPYFTRGPFGGAVLNMAMNNFHRIVKKSNSPQNRSGATSPAPPLARERPQRTVIKAPEDDVHVTNSNSVLSAGELQELKSKSMHQGTSLLQLAQLLQEHRHFAFIAFTLMLAVFVYFLTHKNLEDDVT